jgi:hypothetical protein
MPGWDYLRGDVVDPDPCTGFFVGVGGKEVGALIGKGVVQVLAYYSRFIQGSRLLAAVG